MSEFAKQPHPDAAHRERLSREIPGLSPRQVQVWFQNRYVHVLCAVVSTKINVESSRAKIKRLTADDRDRMIKMRAVPDDFDNVQALHSPYGAVHNLGGTPISSPVDFGTSAYAEHMMRPLMVDTMRRPEGEDHLSPTGLTPGFGSIGFPSAGGLSNPDILSPLSPPSDRGGYYSSLTSPLGSGPRSSNPYNRQNSMDSGSQMAGRQAIRPLQPLHLRDTLTRSRSENLHSPLRSSMSWKGDSIDYNSYHHGSGGSPTLSARQQSMYQPEPMSGSSSSGIGYESGTYTSKSTYSYTSTKVP